MRWNRSLLTPTNAHWKDVMPYWLKLMLNSDEDLALFRQKQILSGLLVTKLYKKRTMKISLFNYSMLGYISPITTSLPISIEDILVQPISLKRHTRLISSMIFCKKLDFLTANHKRQIKLHWTQFPMVGNTYLELIRLKNPF